MKSRIIFLLLLFTLVACVPIDGSGQISKTVRPGDVTRNGDWAPVEQEFDGITMVYVPKGCFWMGSDADSDESGEDEQPVHEQCIDRPFWIDKQEVTNAEFARFMEAGGYDDSSYWTKSGWEWRESQGITEPDDWELGTLNAPQQPVVALSWYEAEAYAAWRGVALCTEVQWEFAARGPESWIYPWGNEFVADNVVYTGNSRGRVAEVGSRPTGASWVGALDMSGNVGEWTRSMFKPYPYINDGREDLYWIARRAIRGGVRYDNETNVRASTRESGYPERRDNAFGFRACRPDDAPVAAQPLTLLGAWDLAQKHALAWSDDAALVSLGSVDVNDQDQTPLENGERRVWQARYKSANLQTWFQLQIEDGVVTSAVEESSVLYDPRVPAITERPAVDSPDALKKVQAEFPDFSFSVGKGKGFHFGLQADNEGRFVIIVVGSTKAADGIQVPTSVHLDPSTGDLLESHILP
jgi:formylglycine-generating enzyme required for sulfatase activity